MDYSVPSPLFRAARITPRHLGFLFPIILVSQNRELSAQQLIDLGNLRECRSCTIELTEIARLGDANGPGIVEGATIVRWDENNSQWVTFEFGRTEVKRYAADGTFLSVYGTEGDGPGEFRRISDLSPTDDDRMIILDSRRRRWMTFDHAGRFLDASRLDLPVGRFFHLNGDSVVIGAMDRRPQAVGYPFHIVDTSSGEILSHFGSASGEFNIARAYAQLVLMGRTMGDGTVWRGRLDDLHLEEWSLEGEPRTRVSGELPWLREPPEPGGPPSQIVEFAVDREGVLWIVSRIPDPNWRDVERQGMEAAVRPEDRGQFWDFRLDAVSLSSEEHLGTVGFSDETPRIIDGGSRVAAAVLEYDEELTPKIVIYGLRPPAF